MNRKSVSFVVLALTFSRVALAAGELAQRLPRNTVAYAEVDVRRFLDAGLSYIRFVDPEQAQEVAFHARTLLGCLKELAGHYEFRPELFDKISEAKLYLVVMAKDNPIVKTHTYKARKWDRERREYIEGEFEEHTYTTRTEYAVSFAAETTGEAAANLMEEFKALQERLREERPDSELHGWKEIEVEEGEMISDPSGDSILGRFQNYIVFSNTNPVELWAALMAPADPSLAETELYGRYTQPGAASLGLALLNTGVLIEKLEESLVRKVREAEEKLARESGERADEEERGFDRAQVRVQAARSNLDTFLLFKRLLSLDKVKFTGMNVALSVDDEAARSEAAAALHLGEPISPILEMLLDGGHALQAPEVGEREGVCVMLRLGLKDIYGEVVENLDPKYQAPFLMIMGAMKMQLGYDLAEVLEGVAGDVYVFMDFVRKEREKKTWDPEERALVTEKVVSPLPEFLVLLGLNDNETFSEMLSNIFTRLSAMPGTEQVVRKRMFLGTDVYVVGTGVGEEGAEPDGLTSFAAAVVGRHLCFGNWKDVTDLIRRSEAGPDRIAAVVSGHQDANFLAVIPSSFGKKVQEMMREEAQQDPLEEIRKGLKKLPLPTEDEELARTLKSSLEKLLESLMAISEEAQGRSSGAVGYGRYSGGFYEIKLEDRIGK